MSYRQKPDDPQTLIKHFGGIVRTGPVELRPDTAKRSVRDFRYPDDLRVSFHPRCAPKVNLPEKVQQEIAKILAEALVADYQKTLARWEPVRRRFTSGLTAESATAKGSTVSPVPRFPARVGSFEGRRVFTMARAEWERLTAHEGELVEIDVERVPTVGVGEPASVIACLASQYSVHTARIEVWRYDEKDRPRPYNLQKYLVLEDFTRRVNLPMFAERASTKDSPRSADASSKARVHHQGAAGQRSLAGEGTGARAVSVYGHMKRRAGAPAWILHNKRDTTIAPPLRLVATREARTRRQTEFAYLLTRGRLVMGDWMASLVVHDDNHLARLARALV